MTIATARGMPGNSAIATAATAAQVETMRTGAMTPIDNAFERTSLQVMRLASWNSTPGRKMDSAADGWMATTGIPGIIATASPEHEDRRIGNRDTPGEDQEQHRAAERKIVESTVFTYSVLIHTGESIGIRHRRGEGDARAAIPA